MRREDFVFVHAVYFWLKKGLSEKEHQAFENGVSTLKEIETVKHCFIGKPADTDRPVIDRSYDYALVVVFNNKADHDVYQVHHIHDVFRDNFSPYFLKVQIYDSE
jgi:hypothetical protein